MRLCSVKRLEVEEEAAGLEGVDRRKTGRIQCSVEEKVSRTKNAY